MSVRRGRSRVLMVAALSVAFTVVPVPASAATKPDLVVTSVGVPARVALGSGLKATATVKNQGGSSAGSSKVAISLSKDTKVGGDIALGTLAASTTASGASVKRSGTLFVPLSTPRGRYYIVACADSGKAVAESVETNNCRVSSTRTLLDGRPIAVDDPSGSLAATLEDQAVFISNASLLANDSDPEGDALSVVSVAGSAQASATKVSNGVTLTPGKDVNGPVTFTYTISDGASTDTATATVTVTPVQDAPVAVNDSASGEEDQIFIFAVGGLLANDTDADGDELTIEKVLCIAHCASVTLASTQVSFTPAADFAGIASFAYVVSDGTDDDIALVRLQVEPLPDAPIAVDDALDVLAVDGGEVQIQDSDLLANDSDGDGDPLSLTAVSNASGGGVILSAGVVTFTPTAGAFGPVSFDYTITDGSSTDTGHVTFDSASTPTVRPFWDAGPYPAIQRPFTFASLLTGSADADGDDYTIVSVGQALHGTVAINGTNVVFTPTIFDGIAAFTFTVEDSHGLTATGTVTYDVVGP